MVNLKRLGIIAFGAMCIAHIGAGCVMRRNTVTIKDNEDTVLQKNFTYDQLGRMHLSVLVDEKECDAIFDTGSDGLILDDSLFHYLGVSDSLDEVSLHYLHSNDKETGTLVPHGIDVIFDKDTLHYNEFVLLNIRKRLDTYALLSIPLDDSHVWHIDYQHMNLSIHDTVPEGISSNPDVTSDIVLRKGYDYFITLPFTFVNEQKDTLISKLWGLIDTGADLAITSFGRKGVFENSDMAAFLSHNSVMRVGNPFKKCYFLGVIFPFQSIADITLQNDSHWTYLAFGNNLLCHFDLWLDLKERKMFGKTIDNYILPYQEYCETTGTDHSFITYSDDGIIINYVSADHILNAAGIKRGDVILAVDDKLFPSVRRKDLLEFDEFHPEHLVLIRRGSDTLHLRVLPKEED